MEYGTLNKPKEFFHQLGGLHDARIDRIAWLPEDRSMSIEVDDLNSNFLDLPEYEGLTPARLVLQEVLKVELDLEQTADTLNIYEMAVESAQTTCNVRVSFWPSGRIDIICKAIEVHPREVNRERK